VSSASRTPPRIAIVPARGGSKRIPQKNKKAFNGRPLIEWILETAVNSDLFEGVFVSTDDLDIARISRNLGAEIPFIRPDALADDYAITADVVVHTLENIPRFNNLELESCLVCVIYPTGVFTTKLDLIKAFELIQNGTEHVISVGRYSSPVQRAWRINENGLGDMVNPQQMKVRTQDLEAYFYDAGQFYCSTANAWRMLANGKLPTTALYELPKDKACDIDTEEDWRVAEILHSLHISNKKQNAATI
jgi:pseudaminic acid cytidylyltransferase